MEEGKVSFKHIDQTGNKNSQYKHGMTNTPTWNSWRAMHRRVAGSDSSSHIYLAKGIKICKRWYKFENFFKDMGKRPAGKTLDRIDNDGDYKPSNCRWATAKEQVNNQDPRKKNRIYKNARLITYNGETKTLNQWSEILGVSVQAICYRLSVGKDIGKIKKHR